MDNRTKLDTPLNSTERFLHAVSVRLDILIEQNNSIIDYIASRDGVAVTDNVEVTDELVEGVPFTAKAEEIELTIQCQGVTSRGAQCKRNAQEGSVYCSIHEPKEE